MTTTFSPDATAVTVAHDVRATGGSTRSVTGEGTPDFGYMVSLPGYEETYRLWSDETISDYVSRHRDALNHPRRFVGAWMDGGTLYLDVSVWHSTPGAAQASAKLANQLAYWDLASQSEIRLDTVPA